jgi:hypothetical protein
MTYILYNPGHTIKTFMDYMSDVPLQQGESFTLSPLSFEEYSQQFVLSHNAQPCDTVMVHVGDPAVLIDVSAPGQAEVGVSVNGQAQTVTLTNGRGSFLLPTDREGRFILTPADRQHFCTAGSGSLLVVIENPEN